MTPAVLSSTGATAALAQPRVLLASIVLTLAVVDRAIVVADWLATSVATSTEARPGSGPAPLLFPLVALPLVQALLSQ